MSAVDVLRADCSTVTYGMLVYVCCCVCCVPPLQGTKAPLQFGMLLYVYGEAVCMRCGRGTKHISMCCCCCCCSCCYLCHCLLSRPLRRSLAGLPGRLLPSSRCCSGNGIALMCSTPDGGREPVSVAVSGANPEVRMQQVVVLEAAELPENRVLLRGTMKPVQSASGVRKLSPPPSCVSSRLNTWTP